MTGAHSQQVFRVVSELVVNRKTNSADDVELRSTQATDSYRLSLMPARFQCNTLLSLAPACTASGFSGCHLPAFVEPPMRTRIFGGVGRAISDDGRYPIEMMRDVTPNAGA